MNWGEALILGILQGLTEFIPVSSSGHLELGSVFFGLENPEAFFTFNILVHGATFLSVVVVFFQDIRQLIASAFAFRWNADTRFIALLLISAVPVGIVGLLFESHVEKLFQGRVVLVGAMLLVTSLLLFLTRIAPSGGNDITLKSSVIIGLSQVAAILPGVSRSGTTISTALYLGVEKATAVRFSFLMALFPIFGANLLKIISLWNEANAGNTVDTLPLVVGTVAAFLAGLFACRWMLDIVRRGSIYYFSAYCLLAGLAAIGYGVFG